MRDPTILENWLEDQKLEDWKAAKEEAEIDEYLEGDYE